MTDRVPGFIVTDMTNTPFRAALYTRISEADENVDKPANQEAKLRKIAASAGYTVAAVYVDDDISAYGGKLERPGWSSMLEGIRSGQFDVVMAVAPDRLTRGSATDLENLAAACIRAHAVIHTGTAGVQDPAVPVTRAMLGIQDIFGGLEVAIRIQKQRERNEAEVAKGSPLWGRRPFGFVSAHSAEHEESEAALIREGYAAVLAGASVYSVAQTWGKPVTVTRNILLNPRNAGWLVYKGERISRTLLPSIVEEGIYDAVVTIITDPGRRPKRGPKQKALLSGILTCACGAGLIAEHHRGIYKCNRVKGGPGHQSVRMAEADDAVVNAVLEAVASGKLGAEQPEAEALRTVQLALAENSRQRDAADALLMDPDIRDKSRAKARVLKLEAERTGLEAERDRLLAASAGSNAFAEFRAYAARRDALDPSDFVTYSGFAERKFYAREAWDALGLDKQRAIIRGAFTVSLAAGRGAGRVRVEPR